MKSEPEVTIRARNGWMYAVIRRRRGLGRAIVKRLGTQSIEEARAIVASSSLRDLALADRADALGREVWIRMIAGRRVRARDAVEAYGAHRACVARAESSIAIQNGVIDRFLRHTGLANESINRVDAAAVSGFVNREGGYKLATRTQNLAILRSWLEYCVAQRWLVSNPCLDVAVRVSTLSQEELLSEPHVPFTDEEVRRILAAIAPSNFWHGAVLLGNTYGLRISDVITLEWSNLDGNRIRVYTRKGRRIVNQPLTSEVTAWFEHWRTVRPASDLPYCFPAQAASSANRASEAFSRICVRLGIEGKTFHSLRKAAAERHWNDALSELGPKQSQAIAKFVTDHGFAELQRLLGHAPGSDVTSKHYMARAQP